MTFLRVCEDGIELCDKTDAVIWSNVKGGPAYDVIGLYQVLDNLNGLSFPGDMLVDLTRKTRPMPMKKLPGTSQPNKKPKTIWVGDGHTNQDSRNGQPITGIVLHYTTDRNVHGSIEWFLNPEAQVSAHYIVDRDGTIFQVVADDRKAWHCWHNNTNTIGIEHVAQPGDTLTTLQEKSTVALIKYLKDAYKIPNDKINGHRFMPDNAAHTDCPGSVWANETNLRQWINAKL